MASVTRLLNKVRQLGVTQWGAPGTFGKIKHFATSPYPITGILLTPDGDLFEATR